jgi:secondary thiamine-phosphate synthase enzyme
MITLTVRSQRRNEFINITSQVENAIRTSGIQKGYCLLYVPHTTAGITVNEGADPSVQEDILNFLVRTVPSKGGYAHSEGNADAHIKCSLVGVSRMLLIEGGKLLLGTWQAIFFCEFDGPRNRRVFLKITKEPG